MDPATCGMATRLPEGQFLPCPEGGHMAMYDDRQTCFGGPIRFLHGLE